MDNKRAKDIWDLYMEKHDGPTMCDQQQAARLALHARTTQIAERLMMLERVKRVLRDDDLELDFLGIDVPGLSLARVRADVSCEETDLRYELEAIQRDPSYKVA